MKIKYIYWAAWVSYGIAVSLPVLIGEYGSNYYGYEVLANGFLGFIVGQYAWFANIFLIVALRFVNKEKYLAGMIFSGLASLLGLQTFQLDKFPLDEGGSSNFFVDYLGYGFYFWELAFILIFVHCLTAYLKERKPNIAIIDNKEKPKMTFAKGFLALGLLFFAIFVVQSVMKLV